MTVDRAILLYKYKTGKNPREEDPKDLLLSNFVDQQVVHDQFKAAIHQEEEVGLFDFSEGILPHQWGMLLNDKYGDCVPAGIMHTQFVFSRLGGHHFEMTDAAAERNYEAMGGWDPNNPVSTDQGCDLRVAAKVWQKQGVLDATGTPRHSGLYVFLEPGNVPLLYWAVKNLKAAVLGYDLPRSAMEQTYEAEEKGETPVWSYDPSSPSEGGHCVPGFGRVEVGNVGGRVAFKSVSWGEPTIVMPEFVENKMDDGFVVVSSSVLKEGQIEGLDHQKMLAIAEELKVAA